MLYEKNADVGGHLNFQFYDFSDIGRNKLSPIPHFHNSIEICVVKKGSVSVFINGAWQILTEGDVAFIDRLTPHTGGYLSAGEPETAYYVLVASSVYLSQNSWLEKETLPLITHRKDGFSDLALLLDFGYKKIDRNKEMRLGFVTLLLGYLYEYCGAIPRRPEKNNRLVVELMIYLNEHFKEKITLEELSHRFGYEKTYLSRTFNKFMGMNLREYLNRLRIDAVTKERTKNPSAPIYKLAEECGFDNQNTFYRALNKYGNINKHNF